MNEIADCVLLSGSEVAKIETPFNKRLLNLFWFLITLILLLLLLRTGYLTVFKGDYYRAIAKENRLRVSYIKAPRGQIFDKFGTPLVYNVPSLDLVIDTRSFGQEWEVSFEMGEQLKKIYQDLLLEN